MPTGSRAYRHIFRGGLATDLGTLAETDGTARVEIPFLLRAENVCFALDGSVRKIGGTDKYNATVLGSGTDEIRGMFEYIRQGTSGAPTRKRLAVRGTKIEADDNDGTFADLFTGIADDSVPCFCVFEDRLIIATDADEAPLSWDQTTAVALPGTPPHFAFCVVHVNRVWAAGSPANPSRLYYSSLLQDEEWDGAGNSGHIDIDPDDGDVITAIYPFRGELIVFKGPNYGSIHRISGAEPSAFARSVFSRGVSAAGHNLTFPIASDLGFVAQDGSIRSLIATADFGDYRTSALSREIESLLGTITFSSIKRGWAVRDSGKGYTLFALPVNTATTPNLLLMMDTRFERPRYATWDAIDASSLAVMSDSSSSNRLIAYAGGADGFIRKLQQPTRAIDTSTQIGALVKTPYFDYGTPLYKKTLVGVGVSLEPKGDYTITVGYTHSSTSSVMLDQGGGAALGSFVLGTDVLGAAIGGSVWRQIFDSGDFRAISYEISNDTLNQDFEVQAVHGVLEAAQSESYE